MNAHTQSAPRKQSLAGMRLRKHADFQRAYAAARKKQSASMSWFLAPQNFTTASGHNCIECGLAPRIGLTAGKVLGKAHERNRIKRRLRDAVRRHIEMLPPGFDLILHPRRTVLTMEFTKLEAEVVRILSQARLDASRLDASRLDASRLDASRLDVSSRDASTPAALTSGSMPAAEPDASKPDPLKGSKTMRTDRRRSNTSRPDPAVAPSSRLSPRLPAASPHPNPS